MTDDGRQYEDTGDDARYDTVDTPIARLREFIERDRIDAVAVIWMLGVAATIAAGIWTAFTYNLSFDGNSNHVDGWDHAFLLSQTATLMPLIGVVVGLAIAAALDSAASRVAAWIGMVVSAWLVVASVLGIAYMIHAGKNTSLGLANSTGPRILELFAVGVLAVVVGAAAWRVATSVPVDNDVDSEPDAQMVS
jgi:hypothetical protein